MPPTRRKRRVLSQPRFRRAEGRSTHDGAVAAAAAKGRAQAAAIVAARAARWKTRARVVAAAAPRRPGTLAAPAAIPARTLRALGPAASAGLLIAEGDSWFDYPMHDVLSVLEDDFGYDVRSV